MSRKRGAVVGGEEQGPSAEGEVAAAPEGMKEHGDATVTQAVMMLLKSFVGTGVLFLGKACVSSRLSSSFHSHGAHPFLVHPPRMGMERASFIGWRSGKADRSGHRPNRFYNGGILFSIITLCFIAMISLYSFILLVQCSLVIPGSFGGELSPPAVFQLPVSLSLSLAPSACWLEAFAPRALSLTASSLLFETRYRRHALRQVYAPRHLVFDRAVAGAFVLLAPDLARRCRANLLAETCCTPLTVRFAPGSLFDRSASSRRTPSLS